MCGVLVAGAGCTVGEESHAHPAAAGPDALARAVVLFPVMVLGAWAGGRAFHGLASERLYRNVALAILFATGLFGLLRGWLF